MEKTYNIYRNLGYWFLLLILLLALGFYKTYFIVLFQPHPFLIHFHFTLMTLWVITLIVQPFLIQYKKTAWHRRIGRVSYGLLPLLLVTAFLMTRYSYFNFITTQTTKLLEAGQSLDREKLLKDAAAYEAIGFLYITWLGTLYTLGILNRKRSTVHARFMLASALTMLGPTVDRIIGALMGIEKLPGGIPVECFSFFLQDLIILLLLLNDYRRKKNPRPLWICLGIFTIGQLLYFTVPYTTAWKNFVTFLMQPSV